MTEWFLLACYWMIVFLFHEADKRKKNFAAFLEARGLLDNHVDEQVQALRKEVERLTKQVNHLREERK